AAGRPMSAFGGKADIVACRTFFAKISRGREPELEARQGAPARTADRAIHSSKEPYVQKNYNFREAGLEDSGPSEIWGWGSSRTPARGLTSCRNCLRPNASGGGAGAERALVLDDFWGNI